MDARVYAPGIFGGLALLLTIGAVYVGVRGIRRLSADQRLTTRRQLRLAAIRLFTVAIASAGGLGSFALLLIQAERLVGWQLLGSGPLSAIVTFCVLGWFACIVALSFLTEQRRIKPRSQWPDANRIREDAPP